MLTGFQIRAARSYKNLYIKDVSLAIGMHKSTLTRLEAQTTNLAYINCNTRTSLLIKNFYESQKIIFPSNNSIGIRGTTQDFKNTIQSVIDEGGSPKLTTTEAIVDRSVDKLSKPKLALKGGGRAYGRNS